MRSGGFWGGLCWRRLWAALAAGAVAGIVGVGGAPTAVAQPGDGQAGANQAGLVVLHGDGRVVTACVAFDEAEISGMAFLQRSGLELNIDAGSGMGTVCRIDGEGCSVPQESCFCRCEGGSCTYWSYWRASAGGWDYSSLGAGSAVVRPGDVQGWVWGEGPVGDGGRPPTVTLAEICQAPAVATATAATAATATATATPQPAETATPAATLAATPIPPADAAPAGTSTATAAPPVQPTAISDPPRIELFVADRLTLGAGETTTLHWRVANAASVVLHAGGQAAAVDAAGTAALAPPSSVEVRLEASNSSGVISSVLLLSVAAAATVTPMAPAAAPPLTAAAPPLPAAAPSMPVAAPPVPAAAPSMPAVVEGAVAAGVGPAVQTPLVEQRLRLPLILKGGGAAPPAGNNSVAGPGDPPTSSLLVTPAAIVPGMTSVVAFTATAAPPPAGTVAAELPRAGGAAETLSGPGNPPLPGAAQAAASLGGSAWVALAAILLGPAGVGVAFYLLWRLAGFVRGQ